MCPKKKTIALKPLELFLKIESLKKNLNLAKLQLANFFKNRLYFRTVLEFQNYCKDSTVSSPTPHTVLLINTLIWRICHSERTSHGALLLPESPLFLGSPFLPNVLFLSQGPLQDTALHLVLRSP